ncbi:MAG: LysE family translocator [Bacteroidetes bacterium]|nr:LysE family translocator [Bacteroidota bacterium]
MSDYFLIVLTGMGISFLGSLPLGNLNITAMQIAVAENRRRAVWFAIGVALVEMIYVRISLKGIDWIMLHKTLFQYMEWAAVFIFAALGLASLLAARRSADQQKPVVLTNKLPRFLLGLGMSAVNPAQIPFWFAWSSYLFSVKLLKSDGRLFNLYITGIAIGTTAALCVFIIGGSWLVKKINASQRGLNLLVGIVFLLSAAIQLYKILQR